ncbi:MAG TPA: vanadium-dependent haloperoxidase, partial [Steroidobacteraceae bacterium]
EVKAMGGRASTRRTAEQTEIARFWDYSLPAIYHGVLRSVALQPGRDVLRNARLYAAVAQAMDDGMIAVFDAKYHYNFWRPVTAIRNADQTGNPATPRDAGWLPLGETPMHPEYPCAHCITSSAVAAVIRGIVGEDIGTLSLTSTTAPGITRRWTRLEDYVNEVSNARVWAGFHYRFSTEVARDMGRKIGELTVATQLRPLKPKK